MGCLRGGRKPLFSFLVFQKIKKSGWGERRELRPYMLQVPCRAFFSVFSLFICFRDNVGQRDEPGVFWLAHVYNAVPSNFFITPFVLHFLFFCSARTHTRSVIHTVALTQ